MTERSASAASGERRLIARLASAFAILAVVLAGIIFVRARIDAPYPAGFAAVLAWQLAVWLPWPLFGLLIARLMRHYPYASLPVPVWLSIHLCAALGFAAAHAVWYFYLSDAVSPYRGFPDTRYGVFAYFFIFWFLLDVALYGLLLGLVHTHDYDRRYRAQARQVVELERALAETGPGGAAPAANGGGDADVGSSLDFLVVRKRARRHVIPAGRIDWIEARGYYAALHSGGDTFLIRTSLSKLAGQLDPQRFIRVHRSTIVNVAFIASFDVRGDSAWHVKLSDGTERNISRAGRQRLTSRLHRP